VRRQRLVAIARELKGEERAAAFREIGRRRRSVLTYDERATTNGRQMAVFALRPLAPGDAG
jgi:hypothetical protein